MGIITLRSAVLHSDDFDVFESYGPEHSATVTELLIWRFERLPSGYLTVRWSNGAIGQFDVADYAGTLAYLREADCWPDPDTQSPALPFSAGMMFYQGDAPAAEDPVQEPQEEVEYAVRRNVRRRADGNTARRRRSARPDVEM